ncbi:hypothetical protein RR48_07064 [Papilio machaon]|uniref:Uncharacterized protein n=1 Tax=Papilio machaon TaxID=76193 RepID=A0A194R7J3_PAPMA|nr:hypothetical protein RR48_07064 [Papilio machaon]
MGRCWRQSYEVVKRSKPSAAVSRNAGIEVLASISYRYHRGSKRTTRGTVARRRGNDACVCVRRPHAGTEVCVSAAHALTAEYLHRRPLPPRPLMRRAIYRTHVHPTSVRRCNPTVPATHSAINGRRSSLLCASDPSDINSEVN